MNWLDRTHGRRFELVRHFLATMFDSEMFSARGQWGTIAIGALAMVIPAGMILLESPSGRKLAVSVASAQAMAQTERLSSLTLLISITSILALLAWQSLFPSRRDYLALAGLPVRSRQSSLLWHGHNGALITKKRTSGAWTLWWPSIPRRACWPRMCRRIASRVPSWLRWT